MEGSWLRDMQLFVAVARTRSFSRAAVALSMPSSTLSRRIAALEQRLGLRLLNRSTRKVELTEEGELYLGRASHIVEEALLMHEELRERKTIPRGHLRVSMLQGLATDIGMQWLAEFARNYPEITFEINTEPSQIDLIADRFDVAIRSDPLSNSQLRVRRVGHFKSRLYASPSYIATHGTPENPLDLRHHECIRTTDSGDAWTLEAGDARMTVEVGGRFVCDKSILARSLALAGLGIVRQVSTTLAAEEAAGRLVRILPEWRSEAGPVLIVTPSHLVPSRTRRLVDFLVEKLEKVDA